MSDQSDPIRDAISRGVDYVKDKFVGAARDINARGNTIYNVMPAHPADQDIPKMAQEQANRMLGKRSRSPLNSTMTPVQKKGK
jgi:hypothetical protein